MHLEKEIITLEQSRPGPGDSNTQDHLFKNTRFSLK